MEVVFTSTSVGNICSEHRLSFSSIKFVIAQPSNMNSVIFMWDVTIELTVTAEEYWAAF